MQITRDIGVQKRHGDDHHDHGALARRAAQDRPEVGPAVTPVHQQHHDERAEGADTGHLARRRPAAVERDHDDRDKEHKRREPRQRLQALAPGVVLLPEKLARRYEALLPGLPGVVVLESEGNTLVVNCAPPLACGEMGVFQQTAKVRS